MINIKQADPSSSRGENDNDFRDALQKDHMAKHPELMMKIGTKQHVSLKLGVIGSGQAGGRMAEVFHRFGYPTVAINTAKQDLDTLSIPENRRLCLDYTLSGSGKDIEIGAAAIEANIEQVSSFVSSVTEDADVLVLTLSLGGGSGSGSAAPLVELLGQLGKPLLVMAAMPGSFDDSQSKFNATQTLSRLAEFSSRGVISSLIVVDNAKIENTYPNLSPSKFWEVANRSSIEPLHLFNTLTATATDIEVMDAMDLSRALLEAGSCALFGSMTVSREEYESDESALLSAMIRKLPEALPADDFDLKESQAIGILVTAKQSVLDTIPYANIAYLFKYISDEYDSSRSFKGIYAVTPDDDSDDIKISFIFSGMGLPTRRVDDMKKDADKHLGKLDEKRKKTAAAMNLGGSKGPVSKADAMIAKAKQSQSAIGKLLGNKVDRKR
jgi:cell division GTPase FtsZ